MVEPITPSVKRCKTQTQSCVCAFVCVQAAVHLQFVIIPIEGLEFSGGLPGNYTLLSSFHLPRACWAPHFLTNSPRFNWHSYSTATVYGTKMLQQPSFEKPFHFSLTSGTCSNGLLSLHMVPSVTYIQSETRWPSVTSNSGCNYDRPNAIVNSTVRLLLAGRRATLCCIHSMRFTLFNRYSNTFKAPL